MARAGRCFPSRNPTNRPHAWYEERHSAAEPLESRAMIRRFILLFAIVAPVATVLLWTTSIPLAIGLLFLSHMLVLYPTLSPNSQWLGPVATRFETDENEVWLTIDDGPTRDTNDILELLERYRAKATFFVKGNLAERHPGRIRQMRDWGHGVANHSYSHPSGSFWCSLPARARKEIRRTNDVLGETSLFRAPVGHKNPFIHPILMAQGMTIVGWTVRGWDTVSDPEDAASRILDSIKPGDIILLHQGEGASEKANPIVCLEKVLDGLSEKGYATVIPEESRLTTK